MITHLYDNFNVGLIKISGIDEWLHTRKNVVLLHMIILKNINPTKATGYDLIPGKLIRIAHRELSAPLCHIINTSINLRSFPGIMKCAEVSPVYKNTDNLKKNNYRPVSVLTAISKTYETVLNDQMVNHFHALFNDLLSAFRKLYSCQTLLLRFIEDLNLPWIKTWRLELFLWIYPKRLTVYRTDYWQNYMLMASLQPRVIWCLVI